MNTQRRIGVGGEKSRSVTAVAHIFLRAGRSLASPSPLSGAALLLQQMIWKWTTTVFDTITTATLKSSNVPIPDRAERIRFHEHVAPMFETILANQQESRTLAQLRDTLLPKLLSGEVRVGAAEA